MRNPITLVTAGLASAIALGMQVEAIADDMQIQEKCYGIAKAGKNDCKTASNVCAGHAFADNQQDTFVALPAGTCECIAGGSLEAADSL